MNLAWDFTQRHRASKTCDSVVLTASEVAPTGLDKYTLYAASQGVDVAQLPGNQNIAFDEINPVYNGLITPAKLTAYAQRCTKKSVIAVEWTLGAWSKSCVDALLAPRNPLVRVAQEFFFFGEDGPGCYSAAQDRLEWYISNNYQQFLLPLYDVANDPAHSDIAKRAYSKNPGLVAYGWHLLIKRCAEVGVYDGGLWGLIYSGSDLPLVLAPQPPYAGMPMRDPAVETWDNVITGTLY